jgi:hypothetical protein
MLILYGLHLFIQKKKENKKKYKLMEINIYSIGELIAKIISNQ